MLKKRIDEMQWSAFGTKTATDLGLWLGLIYSVVYQSVSERPDEQGLVSLSKLYTPPKDVHKHFYRLIKMKKAEVAKIAGMIKSEATF